MNFPDKFQIMLIYSHKETTSSTAGIRGTTYVQDGPLLSTPAICSIRIRGVNWWGDKRPLPLQPAFRTDPYNSSRKAALFLEVGVGKNDAVWGDCNWPSPP